MSNLAGGHEAHHGAIPASPCFAGLRDVLVVRRRAGQSIFIGKNIEVQVIESTRGTIKLGIQAPPEARVLRTEVSFDTR